MRVERPLAAIPSLGNGQLALVVRVGHRVPPAVRRRIPQFRRQQLHRPVQQLPARRLQGAARVRPLLLLGCRSRRASRRGAVVGAPAGAQLAFLALGFPLARIVDLRRHATAVAAGGLGRAGLALCWLGARFSVVRVVVAHQDGNEQVEQYEVAHKHRHHKIEGGHVAVVCEAVDPHRVPVLAHKDDEDSHHRIQHRVEVVFGGVPHAACLHAALALASVGTVGHLIHWGARKVALAHRAAKDLHAQEREDEDEQNQQQGEIARL
eukprot:scaffold14350_cov98-Isochrysis_galbana.AAC.2